MSTCCQQRCCCDEYNCKRRTPILVRREAFSGRWVAITRHTHDGKMVKASEKHALDPVSQAEIELNGSVLRAVFEHVKTAWSATEDGSEADRTLRGVLDKIAELTEAKETSLLGPRAERAS